MRHVLLISVLSASAAFAQAWVGNVNSSSTTQSGVWTGYVNGWVRDPVRVTPVLDTVGRPTLTKRQRDSLALQQLAAQQNFFATQSYLQMQDLAARQSEQQATQLARQEELAAERRRAEQEQALAAEAQLLAQQQQLAVQQQLLAQQQQQAAAEELARVAEREARLKLLEAEQKLLVEREAGRLAQARAEADAKPREKGPDIHRWVDEDGVVHYSTKPRR